MAGVTLTHVVKTFKNVTAVDDLSIEVKDREFAVFVGPSGCGKTTALRMIAGLEPVTSGVIRIGDRVVNDVEPKDRDIAMVFQNYALYPHMNVRENLGFGLRMRKFPKAEIEARVEEAADILGIQALLERKPRELSGGQRQRVALGRAIVRKPAVFLFDEPLSNLDAKLRVAMRAEISKLHKRLGATIVYVTHDQVEAMTMADRIFVMNKGSLQQAGDPLDLYKNPANRFVAAFIGSPAMNFLEGSLVRDGQDFHLEAPQLRLRLPGHFAERLDPFAGRNVVFGVRPEDMFLPGDGDLGEADVFLARAEVVEKLGAEVFLHLACGPHALVARMETPDRHLAAGQDVTLRIKMAKTHVFDAETSNTIV